MKADNIGDMTKEDEELLLKEVIAREKHTQVNASLVTTSLLLKPLLFSYNRFSPLITTFLLL